HNVPSWAATPAGPFTQWPTGQGYDYFYGFVGGDTSQWQPGNLFRNTTPIHPYLGAAPGSFNLITAMRRRIGHIRTQNEINPQRPGSSTTRRAAPMRRTIDAGMGREDRGDEAVRRRLERAARQSRRHPACTGHQRGVRARQVR
ncbi:MAG: hypothetical protein HC893_17340, partial [Chloroflexaceae bacterium]|nr:hypothetical protein [Chloroflexaceae bacterium]